jgi:isochorismate hydrolase
MTCWKIVKDLRTDIDAETLQQFVELVFAPELLESYYIHSDNTDLHKSLIAFHLRLAEEVIEHSNSYWLILRGFFNHLMFMFATKPWLMRSFEPFIYNFAMARELRSLDA